MTATAPISAPASATTPVADPGAVTAASATVAAAVAHLMPHPERPRPSSPLAAVVTLTRTSLLTFIREPISLAMQFFYPLFMLGIFSAVFPDDIAPGVSYAEYLLPAMITTGILTTCLQHLTVIVATERENGALRRLAGLPAPAWVDVASKCASNTILALANSAMLLLAARYALGIELPTTARSWVLLGATGLLMIAACTALGLAIGRLSPTARSAAGLITPLVIMLQFVSGIFFPLSQLPDWMVSTFSVLPARWSAQLMREALLPSTFAAAEPTGAWETARGLVIVGAWLVAGIIAAIVIIRRDTVDR
ncbi:ABC transporter permease [Actinomyces capricornis]|uniref:Transport permease protein n=1 Tax=Actinomyces capricornis TaxID=2755559 RepID=A0ABN6K509_9ACTO|nr:ABC transporter permease [Actinomyces capricornis]BDA64696.1 transport permease protein [Actinomyces capricornis]